MSLADLLQQPEYLNERGLSHFSRNQIWHPCPKLVKNGFMIHETYLEHRVPGCPWNSSHTQKVITLHNPKIFKGMWDGSVVGTSRNHVAQIQTKMKGLCMNIGFVGDRLKRFHVACQT